MGQTTPHKWWLDYELECSRASDPTQGTHTYEPTPRAIDPTPPTNEIALTWQIELVDGVGDIIALDAFNREAARWPTDMLGLLGIEHDLLGKGPQE